MASSRRILLVDDDQHDIALALRALRGLGLGATIDVARDGEQALDYLLCRGSYAGRTSGNPAVVLLDIKMPKLDGLEVLAQVRSHPTLRTVPVVMLSSSEEPADIARSYDAGTNAYVVKPLSYSEFVGTLERLGAFWALVNQAPADHTQPGG